MGRKQTVRKGWKADIGLRYDLRDVNGFDDHFEAPASLA